MPVMGRFRLRRESRRAFLQSGICSQRSGPFVCGKLIIGSYAALCLREGRSAGVPSALCLSAQFSIFRGHAQISSPSSPSTSALPDYFRGRSFT